MLGQRDLLRTRGSLTAKLRKIAQGEITVTVLRAQHIYVTLKQAREFKIKPRQRIYQREVILYHNKVPWVLGQSTIVHSLLPIHPIYTLGNKPLGDFLFKQKIKRSVFTYFNNVHPGRQSYFYLPKLIILVREFFLPDLLAQLKYR